MKRAFACAGEEWLAWASGTGAYGTGIFGLGHVEAVHFARADAPEIPVLEALVGTGGFANLFDDELVALFHTARRVVDPAEVAQRPVSRRGAGLS